MELTGKDCVYVTAGTLPDEVQVARMLIVGDPGPDAHSLAPVVRTVGRPPAVPEAVPAQRGCTEPQAPTPGVAA